MYIMSTRQKILLAIFLLFLVTACGEDPKDSIDTDMVGNDIEVMDEDSVGDDTQIDEDGIVDDTESSFITIWETTHDGESDDNQIKLPLVKNGTYNFTVYWGDGTEETITSWDDIAVTHTYAEAGEYEVIIEGEIAGWQFYKTFMNYSDSKKLLNRAC